MKLFNICRRNFPSALVMANTPISNTGILNFLNLSFDICDTKYYFIRLCQTIDSLTCIHVRMLFLLTLAKYFLLRTISSANDNFMLLRCLGYWDIDMSLLLFFRNNVNTFVNYLLNHISLISFKKSSGLSWSWLSVPIDWRVIIALLCNFGWLFEHNKNFKTSSYQTKTLPFFILHICYTMYDCGK